MKVQNLRKLLSTAERPATGPNLPKISLNAEATQISKRICRNSGRGQAVSPGTATWMLTWDEDQDPPGRLRCQAETDVLNLPTAGVASAQANGLGYLCGRT